MCGTSDLIVDRHVIPYLAATWRPGPSRNSLGGLSISLPLPHTATHPRKPTVLVRDLSTREVAVKWIAHLPIWLSRLHRALSRAGYPGTSASRNVSASSVVGPCSVDGSACGTASRRVTAHLVLQP